MEIMKWSRYEPITESHEWKTSTDDTVLNLIHITDIEKIQDRKAE